MESIIRRPYSVAALIVSLLITVVTAQPSAAQTAPQMFQIQRGIADPTWYFTGYDNPSAEAHAGEIAAANAEWIVIGPQLLMDSAQSSVIYRDERTTATDQSIKNAISRAHSQGLKVMLRPFFDSKTSGRTVINPSDRGLWFGWYRYWMNHYAALAESMGVEQMSIGANYEKLSQDAKWFRVIEQVRERYSGLLTYDATIYEYKNVTFWDRLDFVGIDAYWSLQPSDQYDVQQLISLWAPITEELSTFSERIGRKILFTEAGYRSISGAVTNPVSWQNDGQVDEAAQSAAYEALILANWGQPYFAGVHWWQWDIAGKLDETKDYTPNRKAAGDLLTRLWALPDREIAALG